MGKLSAALISLGSISSKMTATAMRKHFDSVDEIDLRKVEVHLGKDASIIYKGDPLKEYDCVYAKGSYKYGDILRAVSTLLWGKCYQPLAPESFTVGHDKLLTHLEILRYKVPSPNTYFMATTDAAKSLLKKLNFPIIMKFPRGTHGKGVMFADSYESANSMLDALAALNQPFIVQEYIETGGIDIRAIVIGDRVVAAMQREAVQGEKRANLHAGGVGKCLILDYQTSKIAVDTAKALKCDICAVDLLKGIKQSVVIEANLSPGLQGVSKVCKKDIAGEIASYLYQQTQQFKSKTPDKAQDVLKELGIRKADSEQELMTTLDFRGARVILPEMVTKICGFDENMDVVFKVKAGKLVVQKLEIGK